ncbi:NUDIX hydrolase [Salicola sp. Rm-C-2C1-2]|uniref:NUDIX hydrolase n=1 Tax=Salicola sp. Rm-C-2C1-2 TaxID=3141321 RepID=UPI0032E44F87
MQYCSSCGAGVAFRIPQGDDRERHVCENCGIIHYINPRIVAGTLPVWDERILLCRRAIEPRYGFWTLPAGFMENGETTTEAALRETLEEAEARVELDGLYAVLNVPHIDQVHMYFRARLIDGQFGAGPESLETALFRESEIPWEELAFPTVTETLNRYFSDRNATGEHFEVMVDDIRRRLGNNR